jgi:DNA-binding Xre family transcriptional regulator
MCFSVVVDRSFRESLHDLVIRPRSKLNRFPTRRLKDKTTKKFKLQNETGLRGQATKKLKLKKEARVPQDRVPKFCQTIHTHVSRALPLKPDKASTCSVLYSLFALDLVKWGELPYLSMLSSTSTSKVRLKFSHFHMHI